MQRFLEHVAMCATSGSATSRVTGWWSRTVNGGERRTQSALVGLQSFAEGLI